MSLSKKSDQEIIQLLKEYGIKHGPIVGTTRGLYEKKLQAAMAQTPPSSSKSEIPTVSSDKTYYREEEEEVTFVHYRTPVKSESSGDMLRKRETHEQVHHDNYKQVHHDNYQQAHQDSYQQTHHDNYLQAQEKQNTQPVIRLSSPVHRSKVPNQSAAKSKEPIVKSEGRWFTWLRLLLLAGVAGFFYFVYCSMESQSTPPFGQIP